MDYVCVKFTWMDNDALSDIIIALLGDSDYDMFEENETELKAYIPKTKFRKEEIQNLLNETEVLRTVSFSCETINSQNWNAVWESNYDPIFIKDEVYIRAPFHPTNKNVKYELLIQPKMSFGTGHHDTTKLMIEYLLTQDIKTKHLLDMGTGTGVLAILAEKMGAADALAIDIDKNCIINSVENCMNNNCSKVAVLEGDIDNLGSSEFDIILANINKNVILIYMQKLVLALKKSSILIISGFYESDLEDIEKEALKYHLKLVNEKVSNNWCAALFSNH